MKNADIIYFNYDHLHKVGRGDAEAIIILTHGLIKGYNKTMGITSARLMLHLNVNRIPSFLFQQGTLYSKNNLIYSRYKTYEPQSYIKNIAFLFYQVDVKYKLRYLQMLSKRRINEFTDRIPLNYFEDLDARNPLYRFDGDNLFFNLESLKEGITPN